MGIFSPKGKKKKDKEIMIIEETTKKVATPDVDTLSTPQVPKGEKPITRETTDKTYCWDGDLYLNQLGTFNSSASEAKKPTPKFAYKPTVYEKLTIILIENTEDVLREQENVLKIVKGLVKSGYVYIINYGSIIRKSEMIDVSTYDYSDLLYAEDAKSDSRLYDALFALKTLIYEKRYRTIENQNNKIMFNDFEIIGIGKCINNVNSTISKEEALAYFCKVATLPDVKTKYFCLTEDSFIEAATVGFRSIGAIYRNYK